MATRIRLKRVGRKKKPLYRIVIVDQRAPRDGRSIEEIGFYDPKPDPPVIEVDAERALDWLKKGAQPSDTARSLLRAKGIMRQLDAIKQDRPLRELPAEQTPTQEAPPEAPEPDQEQEAEAAEPEADDN